MNNKNLYKKYNYEIENIETFISSSIYKTPSMIVHVQNENKKIVKSFEVPCGFQLEKYVSTLFPDDKLEIGFLKNLENETIFKVDVKRNDKIITSYLGFYDKQN